MSTQSKNIKIRWYVAKSLLHEYDWDEEEVTNRLKEYFTKDIKIIDCKENYLLIETGNVKFFKLYPDGTITKTLNKLYSIGYERIDKVKELAEKNEIQLERIIGSSYFIRHECNEDENLHKVIRLTEKLLGLEG